MLKFERVVEGNNRALIVKNVTKQMGFDSIMEVGKLRPNRSKFVA